MAFELLELKSFFDAVRLDVVLHMHKVLFADTAGTRLHEGNDIVDIHDGVDGEAELLCDIFVDRVTIRSFFHAVHHDDGGIHTHVGKALHEGEAFAERLSLCDDILHDDDIFFFLRKIADEDAVFDVVLHFLAIEKEGDVQTVLGQGNGCGNGNGNALICGAVKNGLPSPDLIKITFCVKFTEGCELHTRFDLGGVDGIGRFFAVFFGDIAESQRADVEEKADEFLLIILLDHKGAPFLVNF